MERYYLFGGRLYGQVAPLPMDLAAYLGVLIGTTFIPIFFRSQLLVG